MVMQASALPGLPSMEDVWGWHQQLAAMGTRFTGSPGHVRFTDWLQQQFSAVPGFELHTDRYLFQRWLAQGWSLSIDQGAAAGLTGPVPVSYYYPYSGMTDGSGVSGRLVDLGECTLLGDTPTFWAPATGEIALVHVPHSVFPSVSAQLAERGFEPGQDEVHTLAAYDNHATWLKNPVFQGISAPVNLRNARDAGVRGVICAWPRMSGDQVANQYTPFFTGYPNSDGRPRPNDLGCPALWVGKDAGDRLHAAARGNARVTLTLTADITVGAA